MGLESGKISLLSVEDSVNDPSYLVLSDDKTRIYAVAEGGKDGSVAAYRIDGDCLEFINTVKTGGSSPCHLCLSRDGRFIYAANYGSGSISVISMLNGAPDGLVQLIQHEGAGPNLNRQEGPHAHQVCLSADGDYLCAADLGVDSLFTYAVDKQSGCLTYHDRFRTEAGAGPRHMAFSPDSKYAYLAHELANAVTALEFSGGRFTAVQLISTLPVDFCGTSYVAAIRVSPDGERLCVSNRGHDSLAAFDIKSGGALSPAGYFSTHGRFPRDFQLIDNDRALIANQDSGDVTLIEFAGGESKKVTNFPMPGAVCICC
jgi:6-phosphogluconolactonase